MVVVVALKAHQFIAEGDKAKRPGANLRMSGVRQAATVARQPVRQPVIGPMKLKGNAPRMGKRNALDAGEKRP